MNPKFWKLVNRIPHLDKEAIQKTIDSYENYSTHTVSDDFRELAVKNHPILKDGQYYGDLDFNSFISIHKLKKREEYNKKTINDIEAVKNTITLAFPSSQYSVLNRLNSAKRVTKKEIENGPRAHLDTVGFRIIPHRAIDIIKPIEWIENQQKWKVLLKLNTIPLTKEKFKEILGPKSSYYYRVIHYYIDIGGVCAEIQIHTPAISQWAELHHITHYKPEIEITDFERDLVMQFGEIANWVDFKALTTEKY